MTLARPTALPQEVKKTWTQQDVREVPTAKIKIQSQSGKWPLHIGLIPELPVPLLLGRDWPGLPHAPSRTTIRAKRWQRKSTATTRVQQACMAQGEGDTTSATEGEKHTDINFAWEQMEDDHQKHCWAQVWTIKRINQKTRTKTA